MLCKFRIGAQWEFFGEEVRTIVRIGAVTQYITLARPDGSEFTYTRRNLAMADYVRYIGPTAEQLSFPSIAPAPAPEVQPSTQEIP